MSREIELDDTVATRKFSARTFSSHLNHALRYFLYFYYAQFSVLQILMLRLVFFLVVDKTYPVFYYHKHPFQCEYE
jgi:hypothetical protein